MSLDSLAIYKKIDIASAKPTVSERQGVKHFGIDLIYPNENFSVKAYIDLYKQVKLYCQNSRKNLLIIGGTGFYLHALTHGVSKLPHITPNATMQAKEVLSDLQSAYRFLLEKEPSTKIKQNDRYRIQKWYELWFTCKLTQKQYFAKHPPQPVIEKSIPIFEIDMDRELLRKKIDQRTEAMFAQGIVTEVSELVSEYGKDCQPFGAIGIKEVIEYLDGKSSYEQTKELVATNTKRLAKRQRTFNRSKFTDRISLDLDTIGGAIKDAYGN